ncbi:DUF5363 family protein [Zobellella aerophila]
MKWIRRWLANYDAWCREWGLLPEHRRSCTPRRKEPE